MDMQGDYSPQALESLRFRRQFFLGPDFIKEFTGWTSMNIGTAYCLTVHPDLEVCQVSDKNKSITLLGFILDPNNPQAGNLDVLRMLLSKFDGYQDFWKHTSELGGRWVLVVDDGAEAIVFTDAAGLRSLYYSQSQSLKTTFCSSQPGLIAKTLNLSMDRQALEYINSRELDDHEVYWLPGDASMYREVRALLPNHYLNLRTGESHRFWPDTDLKSVSYQEAVTESARLLRGLMVSARQRFNLALSLTAGWDSRMMLALSRDMIRDLYCFTLTYPHSEHSRDVTVPAQLLKTLGVKHSLVRYPESVDSGFQAIYQRNIDAANTAYCADAQGMYDQYPQGLVCITGDVAEIVKCYYRLGSHRMNHVSAQDLASLCGIGTHPFLIQAFERWLSASDSRNVHTLDLFCWEQIAGRKQALIRAQYDIAHESFAPFNCRRLFLTMLSVDETSRRPPEHRFLRELIEQVWPEVLLVPINPPEKVQAKNLVVGTLKRLRLYQFVPQSAKRLGKGLSKWFQQAV